MKVKRDSNKQTKTTGTVHSVQEQDESTRKKEDSKAQEEIRYERQSSKRVTKRVYHPDGPGGSYDGL